MARPSKEEVVKREKIKELGLFVRDSNIYKKLEDCDKQKVPYLFSEYALFRCESPSEVPISHYHLINISNEECSKHIDRLLDSMSDDGRSACEYLEKYNTKLLAYYLHIYEVSINERINNTESIGYKVYNELPQWELQEILGKKRGDELYYDGFWSIDTNNIKDTKLTDDEIIKFREYLLDNGFTGKTIIMQNKKTQVSIPMINTSNTYINIDLTKPLEESIEFLTKIKNDFDNDPKAIPNIYDLFGVGGDIYRFDLKNSDIYKSNHIKPLGGRLADVLFIYDCKKAGLDNDYIIDEINKYWIEIKNLYKDQFRASTLAQYYNLAKDYIDNEKYKCYLSGYDSNP